MPIMIVKLKKLPLVVYLFALQSILQQQVYETFV